MARADALHVVDRCFLHGDIVGRAGDPAGQTGTVVNVSISADVRWCKSGQTAAGVDARDLTHICPIKIGCERTPRAPRSRLSPSIVTHGCCHQPLSSRTSAWAVWLSLIHI